MAAVVQPWAIRGAIPQHCAGIHCVFSLLGSVVGSNLSFLILSAPLLTTVFFGTYSPSACSSRQTFCIRRFYSTENFCLYIARRSDFYKLFKATPVSTAVLFRKSLSFKYMLKTMTIYHAPSHLLGNSPTPYTAGYSLGLRPLSNLFCSSANCLTQRTY